MMCQKEICSESSVRLLEEVMRENYIAGLSSPEMIPSDRVVRPEMVVYAVRVDLGWGYDIASAGAAW